MKLLCALHTVAFNCCILLTAPAQAQIAVSPVILDLPPSELQRAEFEVTNGSNERVYVSVDAARIDNAGEVDELRLEATDPEAIGLLASPPKLIVEPGERRFVRVAALAPPADSDQIYRVAVKPVVGEVAGKESGVKVLVGYDLLVIQRPAEPSLSLDWENTAEKVVIKNNGNSNAQMINGRSCKPDQQEESCHEVPSRRLYAGNEMTVAKDEYEVVSYDVLFMGQVTRVVFE